MNFFLDKQKLSSNELNLLLENPSGKELESEEFAKDLKSFYKIVSSKKESIKSFLLFDFSPLYTKIFLRKNDHSNIDEWNSIKFGYKTIYRFNHIKTFFKKNINIVYEFGSGASTIVFAKLLKDQYEKKGIKGKIYTFDQSRNWLDEIKKNTPHDLLEFINFNYSKLQYFKHENIRFLKYNIKKYHKNIDLVYVDGPTHQLYTNLPKTNIYQANGNIIEMMNDKLFNTAFTDKRFYYYIPFKNHINGNYKISLDKSFKSILLKKI